MTWQFLNIRTVDETDAGLYPVVGPDLRVRPLPDEAKPETVVARGVEVYELNGDARERLVGLRNIRAEIQVTDQRVLFACAKFDKGGGWWGFGGFGLFFALTANAVSKARAAHRRHGKMLVGHVRYQWLAQVGFMPKGGFGSDEQIRLVVKTKDGTHLRTLLIDFLLPRDVSSRALATRIAQRAAGFDLDQTSIADPDERAAMESIRAGAQVAKPEPKKFAMITLPRSWFVTTATVDASALTVSEKKQAPEPSS